jgi:riboflavin synthase
MFTGIIEEVGTVKSIVNKGNSLSLTILCNKILTNIHKGDSIAVNGVCLTVTSFSGSEFKADVSPETFKITNLKFLQPSSKVNLEPALTLSKPLGGHIVSGHIDSVAKILSIRKIEDFLKITVGISSELRKYMVQKGSVAIDGISLTINELNDIDFNVMIIPHTIANTTLVLKKEGDFVNIETDVIAKYVENFVSAYKGGDKGITADFLAKHGFYK